MTGFVASFAATFVAILDIFVVILLGGLLVRRGVISDAHITALSTATVTVFLPCLIYAKVVATLDPHALPLWWAIPLSAVAMSLVGLALAALAFAPSLVAKRDLLPLASMQNAGYLVLPIGLALYPERFDEFALYCFLFILGFNPVLWSVGALLTTRRGRLRLKDLLTPPLLANLVAVLAVLTHAAPLVPQPLMRAVDLLGSAAVPLATFILGAVLGSIPVSLRGHVLDAVRTVGIKLLALPALTVAVVWWLGLGLANPVLARFYVIEAAAAPAVGLILQIRSWGGNERTIGSLMLAAYAACCLTLPAWVAVWDLISR